MEIHLVSSLTPDDENRLAPRVLKAIGDVLERLPVSYSVRIETAFGNAIHHNHTAATRGAEDDDPNSPPAEAGAHSG
jgi:hypothetical protein